MTSRSLIAALVLALVAPCGLAQEPSLAELAKKEKKRRKATPDATRTITESDLGKAGSGTFSAPAGTEAPAPEASPSPAAAASGATPEKTEEELRAERQQKWREDLQKAREDVTKYEDQVAKLEAALGDVSQNIHSASRANRAAALEQAKTQLGQARTKVEELENTGRQNGFS